MKPVHQIAVWSASLVVFAGTGNLLAGSKDCCFLQPPDQSLDQPDDDFIDSNDDGIDGMRCGPIFVTEFGSDLNIGTIDEPMRTIGAAILAASQLEPVRDVYVAYGNYYESVVLIDGVNVYSGYDAANNWARSYPDQATVRLNVDTADYALYAVNLNEPVIFDGFAFLVDRDPDDLDPGSTNVVALVRDCPGQIALRNCTFIASEATNGLDGAGGIAGVDGENGANALDRSGASGGLGGDSTANKGGDGGSGAAQFPCGKPPGCCTEDAESGQDGSGVAGGAGGASLGTGTLALPGEAGGNGLLGTNGLGGTAFDGDGKDGADGEQGSGGGGGAGGSLLFSDPTCLESFGGGGGGGGGGGSGGFGAEGAMAGGSCYGVVIDNSHVEIFNGVIVSIVGGDGGGGGTGSPGGIGGSGGFGAPGLGIGLPGAAGGSGGSGGDSGHGGGGAGGNCIGVLHLLGGSSTIDPGSTVFVTSPGNGGNSEGFPGQNGLSTPIFSVGLDDLPLRPSCAPCCPPTNVHARIVMDRSEKSQTVLVQLATESGLEPAASVSILSPPSHGDAFVVGNEITYSPDANFVGVDTFEFNACRACGPCVNGDAVILVFSDYNANSVPDSCECLADIAPARTGGDGFVNVTDLLEVIGQWGSAGGPADITNDGVVNMSDLLEVIADWGPCT